MSLLRRHYLDGAPVFVTAVCDGRRPLLRADATRSLLLEAMREARAGIPYRMLGWVILADHFHWLLRLEDPRALPRLIHTVKLRVVHRCGWGGRLWQRRYYDHHIRDGDDLRRHLDYIHYNPVKHGWARAPAAYRWSSFHAYVERGQYPRDWGTTDPGLEDCPHTGE